MKGIITGLSLLTSLAFSNPSATAAIWKNYFPNYRKNDFHLTLAESSNHIGEHENNLRVRKTDSVDWWPDPESTTAEIKWTNVVPWGIIEINDIYLWFLDSIAIKEWVSIIATGEDWKEHDLWKVEVSGSFFSWYIWFWSFKSVPDQWKYKLNIRYKSKAKKKGGKAETKRNDKKIPLVNGNKTPITIDCKNIKAESFSACEYLAAWLEGNIGNGDSLAILINDPRIQSISKPTLRIWIVDYQMYIHWSMSYFVIPTQLIKKSPKANLKIMFNGKIISELPTIEDIAQNLSGEGSPSKSVTLSQETKSIKPWVKYKIKPTTPGFITNESILVNGAKVEIQSIDIEKWTYEFIMPQFPKWVKKVKIEFEYSNSWKNNTIKIGSRDTDPKEKEVKDPTLQNLTVTKYGSVSFVKPKNFTCNIVWIVFRAENGKEIWSNTQVDMIITEKAIDGELYIIATPQSAIPITTQWNVKCQIFFNTWLSTKVIGSRTIVVPKD